jgi:hypothetical protein
MGDKNETEEKVLSSFQMLLDMQRPWGEFREFQSQSPEVLKMRGRLGDYSLFPKVKMFVTLLCTEFLNDLNLFQPRIILSRNFVNNNIGNDGWFIIESIEAIDRSFSDSLKPIKKVFDIRHTAQAAQLLLGLDDYRSAKRMIDSIINTKKINNAFPSKVNDSKEDLPATLHCCEVLNKLNLDSFSPLMSDQEFTSFKRKIQQCKQTSLNWIVEQASINDYLWGINEDEKMVDEAFWTSIVLYRLGDVLLDNGHSQLVEKVVDNLFKRLDGNHFKARLSDKDYELTLMVINAINKINKTIPIIPELFLRPVKEYILNQWDINTLEVGENCFFLMSDESFPEIIMDHHATFYNYLEDNPIPPSGDLENRLLLAIMDEVNYLGNLYNGFSQEQYEYVAIWTRTKERMRELYRYYVMSNPKQEDLIIIDKIVNSNAKELQKYLSELILDNPNKIVKQLDYNNAYANWGSFAGAFFSQVSKSLMYG